jgi:alkylation response protein AidB-like acyl-CoA dehydrogenase
MLMDGDVSELRDSARQVLTGLGVAAEEDSTWTQIAALGWLMIATPEALGGLGMGLAGACALHLELGRSLATVPFLPAMLAVEAVCRSSLPTRESLLQRLTAGEEYIAAPLVDCALLVQRDGEQSMRLSGTAQAVPSADRATHALACTADGECVALVPLRQAGVQMTARPTWDATRRLFDLEFTQVSLDDNLVLARGATARMLVTRLRVTRDFALAAEAVGGAAALLALTVDYLQTRQQFGRPLALFQALKHRCADLKALTEGAEALLSDSLGKHGPQFEADLQMHEVELAGMAAKQLACAAYAAVAEEALQLHGGIGMTSEHVCHLFLKRALLNEHLGRAPDSTERKLGDSLLISPHLGGDLEPGNMGSE